MSPLTKDDVWTLAQVADLLSVHPSTVRRMVARGEIPARPFAGRLLFIKQQVDAALLGEPTGVSGGGRDGSQTMKEHK